jgi:hypothetical protein
MQIFYFDYHCHFINTVDSCRGTQLQRTKFGFRTRRQDTGMQEQTSLNDISSKETISSYARLWLYRIHMKINSAVLHVNQELAKGYNAQTIQRLAIEMEDTLEQEEMLQTGSPTGNPDAVVAGGQ